MASATLDSPSSPLSTRRPNQIPQPKLNSPRTPSPVKTLVNRSIAYNGSPKQKENTNIANGTTRDIGNLTERSQNVQSDDVVTIKDLWAPPKSLHKPSSSLSNIPVLRGAARELAPAPIFGTPAFSNLTTKAGKASGTTSIHSPTKSSPQKLRLQSPQKLRERLLNEAKAIDDAEASLQSELSKIGEEMARVSAGSGSPSRHGGADVRRIAEAVRRLESRIPVVVKDLSGRNEAARKELERSLVAAETKVKGLDQLYKEASAENEILYERFNGELGKIVRALKGKGKEDREELVAKVREGSEEAARMRKENARLRREMVSLRALLKAQEMK